MWSRIIRQLYEDSPKANLDKVRARLAGRNLGEKPENDVLFELLQSPRLAQLVAVSLARRSGQPVVLAGVEQRFKAAVDLLRAQGRIAEWRDWRWGDRPDLLFAPDPARVALCLVPGSAEEWTQVTNFKKELGARFTLLTEILLPFTQLTFLQSKLSYFIETLDRLLWRYLGEKASGPIRDLNARWPLAGRTVIEFGPLDGCQTAELIHAGATEVTCIEARPENVTKTRAAADAFGWPQVRVLMDDFHNADATRYGRFDLAFAHGVYYHSIAPFVFLENLRTLADTIFVGGFCATDDGPPSPWLELAYEGRTYRAKQYVENAACTAGVNRLGYFFDGEDLMRFFTERGHPVAIVSDEKPNVETSGRYLRFLVTRPERT